MGAADILQAIKNRDWHSANQAVAQTLQQKLADRLALERKTVFKEGRALTEVVDDSSDHGFGQSTVQRVYGECGSVGETELLCNISNLRVSGGQVVSFTNNYKGR